MQSDKLKNYLHLHFLVFIAGFTAILGELITIDAIPLVWYRMTIAGVLIFLFIKLKKRSLKVPLKTVVHFSTAKSRSDFFVGFDAKFPMEKLVL